MHLGGWGVQTSIWSMRAVRACPLHRHIAENTAGRPLRDDGGEVGGARPGINYMFGTGAGAGSSAFTNGKLAFGPGDGGRAPSAGQRGI